MNSISRLPLLRSLCIFLALLATNPLAAGGTENVLYNFQGATDGSTPVGRLVFDKAGNIYGVTLNGGSSSCISLAQCGTVFKLLRPQVSGDPWTERVLYVFKGNAAGDGATPDGGLVMDGAGNLYGTTSYGGTGNCVVLGTKEGCGTVFELSPPIGPGKPWTEKVLYSFQGGNDGELPWGDLVVDKAGNLYGVTMFGGGYGECDPYYQYCGTAFRLKRPTDSASPWKESVLYGFKGGTDGANPNGGLVFAGTVLYGTTQIGGFNCAYHQGQGCGTVFSLTPPTQTGTAWNETVLYAFKGPFETPQDGNTPDAGVILDATGNLYGTTFGGGEGDPTWGTVYELAHSGNNWSEQLLHSFTFGSDGGNPASRLTFDAKGNIYGTATQGSNFGGGSIFRMEPGVSYWILSALYDFAGYTGDGFYPMSMRFAPKGGLYGTTDNGGSIANCGSYGCGTIFTLKP